MKSQKDYLEDILKLSQDHPSAEIKFFASSEVSDDYPYYLQEINRVEWDFIYCPSHYVYSGEDAIKEGLELENAEHINSFSDSTYEEELDKIFKEKIESKEITEAIVVHLGARYGK